MQQRLLSAGICFAVLQCCKWLLFWRGAKATAKTPKAKGKAKAKPAAGTAYKKGILDLTKLKPSDLKSIPRLQRKDTSKAVEKDVLAKARFGHLCMGFITSPLF